MTDVQRMADSQSQAPDIHGLRADFPGLSVHQDGNPVVYLDNAATTLKPRAMVEAMNQYYLGVSSNVHRGKHVSQEAVSNRYEQARYKVAELIACSANEVVFVRNTTEALNVVAAGLQLGRDDVVVVFAHAHHSQLLPWMARAQVRFVRSGADGEPDLDHYRELLKLAPKVVAITHCSNVTGIYQPLEALIEPARKAGARIVVDAAQSIPHRRVRVSELDIDYLAFSAHKMLGPTGIGVLYGRREALLELTPVTLGGGMVDWVDSSGYRLRKIPHRLEAGTPNIGGAYGLAAAIDYLSRLGFDWLAAHDRDLGALMLGECLKRDYLTPVNADPAADRGGMVSMQLNGLGDLEDVARILSDSFGIMCRHGHLCAQPYVDAVAAGQVLRASAYFYNTREEIMQLFNALDTIADILLPSKSA